MLNCVLSHLSAVAFVFAASTIQASGEPDVLVLGDSQISFGAGAAYMSFFSNLPQHCAMTNERAKLLKKLGRSRTAAIGVRSTSLQSWTERDGRAKGQICDVDERFGVNAGVYGMQGKGHRQYVQIGEGEDYQFCQPGKSAFESAFAPGNYHPKLLILAFLGNSAERWATNPAAAMLDVRRTIAQVPRDSACVFLTTAPVYLDETNEIRVRAQDAILSAFERAGGHCAFVKGLTPEVRTAIEGHDEYFKQNSDGAVIDRLHPQPDAMRIFLEMNTKEICDAVFSALR